jgi:hypothetical protein
VVFRLAAAESAAIVLRRISLPTGVLTNGSLLRIHALAAFGRPAHLAAPAHPCARSIRASCPSQKKTAKAARFLSRDGGLLASTLVAGTLALVFLKEFHADADRLRRQFRQFVTVNECR